MKDRFNNIKATSENQIRYFSVLASGAIVEYFEKKEGKEHNHTDFVGGRVITPAVPNGIAFSILTVFIQDIIGEGTLLHPKEDVRAFEEQADYADREK